jgi:hypothetical protein
LIDEAGHREGDEEHPHQQRRNYSGRDFHLSRFGEFLSAEKRAKAMEPQPAPAAGGVPSRMVVIAPVLRR